MRSNLIRSVFLLFVSVNLLHSIAAQTVGDSLQPVELPEVRITELRTDDISRIERAFEGFNMAGKKAELIDLSSRPYPLAEKTGRQIFSKIPGIIVYDMDGAGNQINISRRGLDPHRGWEFNVRKDGILLNSDVFAYPASHYSIPLESVQRIEMTTGTASLQYGAQFGGLIHYVSKGADTTKAVAFENISSVGSFGLVSTYNSIGGTVGKWRYFAYLSSRTREGYRDEESSQNRAHLARIEYLFSKKLSAQLEWTQTMYRFKSPGPLTDSMFTANPRQATRTRNYYSPTISVPSIKLIYTPKYGTRIQLTASRLFGDRSSVMFYLPATVQDTINSAINAFNPRQVDIDLFNSYTTELKVDHTYSLWSVKQRIVAGVQVLNNELRRRQNGVGTSGADYDLEVRPDSWRRDILLRSRNIAVFGEQTAHISEKLRVTVGARFETGVSALGGTIVNIPEDQTRFDLNRQFLLLSGSVSYKPGKKTELYSALSQNYRPVILRDLTPADAFERIDPNLNDAFGYNAEIGFRGSSNAFSWDVNVFILEYNNRIGIVPLTDSGQDFTTLRTNTGNSRSVGTESLLQFAAKLSPSSHLQFFSSTSFMIAEYTSGTVRTNGEVFDVKGKRVEGVPVLMSTNGVDIIHKQTSIGFQLNYVGESYADARNTLIPSATGGVGLVPSYLIADISARWAVNEHLSISVVANNVLNEQYFTKRPLIYPGPGVWPSDGRNFNLSVNLKL
jgi:Fe(3+) dicitrate transport protein